MNEQITALRAEAERITLEVNDPNNILDSDWRKTLEAKREHIWRELDSLLIYSILGGSNRVNYTGCKVERRTEKALLITTIDSEGSHLHEYNISFWLPKSVFYKGLKDNGAYGLEVTLPHYIHVSVKRERRN